AADGHAEYLVGKLQERYGWTREKAEEEVRDFSRRL
ncbi:CsbD family protein, partial [Pseudomonas nitroreducens]